MSQMMQLPAGVAQATTTGLSIKDGIEFAQWEAIGHELGNVNQGLLWWIGDWLNYGERTYGETYAQAMDATGKSYATVKQAAYMAKKFPPETRREGLTFSHYGVIAGMDDKQSQPLLQKAEKQEWTVSQLKEERAKVENKPPKPPKTTSVTCPHCHKAFNLEDAEET